MQIGIRQELGQAETRVAVTPAGVSKLLKLGFSVAVEAGAGEKASFTDQAYQDAGAKVVSRAEVYQSEVIYAVNPPTLAEVELFKPNSVIVSFIQPAQNPELVAALQARNLTVMAMDMVPRISRAQAMDALSSLANIAGYRAVVEAASQFGRFLNGQITAAGKIAPAKVLVIGAGVAGLAAIGTAKNLGAQVRAFDARPEVKEQVESMGAKFLTIDHVEQQKTNDGYTRSTSEEFDRKSAELYAQQCKEVDIIITTAAIPGRRAPLLLTQEMVASMKPGSVVVDLAAATGGNCAETVSDQVITTANGVKVVGYTNYQAMLANQASDLYSNNLVNLTKLLSPEKDGRFVLNLDDVIVRNMLVILANNQTGSSDLLYPPPPISVSAAPSSKPNPAVAKKAEQPAIKFPKVIKYAFLALVALLVLQLAQVLPDSFAGHLYVFILASILGYFIIWNVHSALHTPLMSLTNALSGIVIVGAMIQMSDTHALSGFLALFAIFIAALNVFGGFAVTTRMLKMFLKKDDKGAK